MSAGKQSESVRKAQTAAEATALAICSAIVLFMLGFSVYHAIVTGDNPPTITAEPKPDEARRRGERWVLPIEVRNHSRPTAEEVIVSVQVPGSDGVPDRRELRIESLPEESTFTGYVTLPAKPAPGAVRADVDSYKLP